MDWSRSEVQLVVADYFAMLTEELSGRPYNKSAHRATLRPQLTGRSDGSIERKHQNISAVLIERSLPYIDGYKPLGNYQRMLADEVDAVLERWDLGPVERVATKVDDLDSSPQTLKLVAAPAGAPASGQWLGNSWRTGRLHRIDYVAFEAANRTLGEAGERLVFEHERRSLVAEGREDLARRVRWVSKEDGDGCGYDIRSFGPDGAERWIEVKTTRRGQYMPFLVSRNEVECSIGEPTRFELHRLFLFPSDPGMFVLRGSLRDTCSLEPRAYWGRAV